MAPIGASAAGADATSWSEPTCSDAAYGGRAAFRCTSKIGTSPYATVTAWATPSIRAQLYFYTPSAVRGVRKNFRQVIADPVDLKLDGRTVRTIDPAQFAFMFVSKEAMGFTVGIPTAFLKDLAGASELGVEFTNPEGARQLATVSLAPGVDGLAGHVRAKYDAYYRGGGKAALGKAVDIDPAIWGPLGEAADRSRFWAFQDSYAGTQSLEFTWLQPDREMQLRKVWCDTDGNCGEYTYVVRATTDAIVDDRPKHVLTFYNESGKPYVRFEGVKQHERYIDRMMTHVDYDPVLVQDMKDHPAGYVGLYSLKEEACCIMFGARKFRPATAGEVEKLFAGQREKLEQALQRKEQEARAERERAEREAQASRIPLDENGQPDRGPDVVPQRAPISFAESLQKSLQASREQDAQQARFLARVERDARATYERTQGRRAGASGDQDPPVRSQPPSTARAGSDSRVQAQAAPATRPGTTAGAGGGDMYFFCWFAVVDGELFYSQVGRVHVPRDQYVATKSKLEAAYASHIRATRNIAHSANTGQYCLSGVTEADAAQQRADGKARRLRDKPGSRGVTDTSWVPRL
jgi:hypothetical protein